MAQPPASPAPQLSKTAQQFLIDGVASAEWGQEIINLINLSLESVLRFKRTPIIGGSPGQFLVINSNHTLGFANGGGGTNPGGMNQSLQYNDSNTFNGASIFTDGTNLGFTTGGRIHFHNLANPSYVIGVDMGIVNTPHLFSDVLSIVVDDNSGGGFAVGGSSGQSYLQLDSSLNAWFAGNVNLNGDVKVNNAQLIHFDGGSGGNNWVMGSNTIAGNVPFSMVSLLSTTLFISVANTASQGFAIGQDTGQSLYEIDSGNAAHLFRGTNVTAEISGTFAVEDLIARPWLSVSTGGTVVVGNPASGTYIQTSVGGSGITVQSASSFIVQNTSTFQCINATPSNYNVAIGDVNFPIRQNGTQIGVSDTTMTAFITAPGGGGRVSIQSGSLIENAVTNSYVIKDNGGVQYLNINIAGGVYDFGNLSTTNYISIDNNVNTVSFGSSGGVILAAGLKGSWPTYADNAAAALASLPIGQIYMADGSGANIQGTLMARY